MGARRELDSGVNEVVTEIESVARRNAFGGEKCLVFSRRARRPSTKELSSGSQGQGGNTMGVVFVANVVPVLLLAKVPRLGNGASTWRYQRRRGPFLSFLIPVLVWDLRWWRWSIAPWSWRSARSWPPDAANESESIDFNRAVGYSHAIRLDVLLPYYKLFLRAKLRSHILQIIHFFPCIVIFLIFLNYLTAKFTLWKKFPGGQVIKGNTSVLRCVFRGQRKTPSCCSRLRLIAQNRDAQQSLADRGIPRGARSVNAFEPARRTLLARQNASHERT